VRRDLRIGDFTLLTDPAFGPAGIGVSLGYRMPTKRLCEPALQALDDVDLDAGLPIVTTPQVERRLRRRFPARTRPANLGVTPRPTT
jgi:hypothetical protein